MCHKILNIYLDFEHNDNKINHSKIITSSTSEAVTVSNKKCHDHEDETSDGKLYFINTDTILYINYNNCI